MSNPNGDGTGGLFAARGTMPAEREIEFAEESNFDLKKSNHRLIASPVSLLLSIEK